MYCLASVMLTKLHNAALQHTDVDGGWLVHGIWQEQNVLNGVNIHKHRRSC